MLHSRLQDDLLQEFREEKDLITAQIELFDPLATSLRKPAAARILGKGVIIFFEIICWLLAAGAVTFCFFRNQLYPFYLLSRLKNESPANGYNSVDVLYLYWSVTGFAILSGILFLIIARNLAAIRKKNTILQLAGTHIKAMVGQHLKRKAAIDAIEQRHFGVLPDNQNGNITAITNPAYES